MLSFKPCIMSNWLFPFYSRVAIVSKDEENARKEKLTTIVERYKDKVSALPKNKSWLNYDVCSTRVFGFTKAFGYTKMPASRLKLLWHCKTISRLYPLMFSWLVMQNLVQHGLCPFPLPFWTDPSSKSILTLVCLILCSQFTPMNVSPLSS